VIVLGLGAVGSAAIYQLARRGIATLGIDQFAPPHALGSTHGETRITRQAIGEGAEYTPLAQRSHALWREIERESGAQLLTITGGLFISSATRCADVHVASFFATTLAAAQRYGIRHEVLDASEIRRRFPAFNVSDTEQGYFEEEAGFLRPEACVSAQLGLAQRHGAVVHMGERVLELREEGGRCWVSSDRARYSAGQVILAAGPWLPQLVPSLAATFRVTRQITCWFEPHASIEPFLPDRFPVFIWEPQQAREALYGFPALHGGAGGVKIASAQYGEATTAESVRRQIGQEECAALHETAVASCFPLLSERCIKAQSCLYTVTRDSGFVIDRCPPFDRVILASACSGHGFKHSAALGEALAELAAHGRSNLDLSPFRLSRLAA
jgi:sarcosine oxidase